MGPSTADDAGVYRISAEVALIQTVDFFTPVVDDPYVYGQIAAANALSDVYAMGGRPITALNICAYPSDKIEPGTVVEIFRGGQDKVAEAGAVVVGGHTVDDLEPKYGLSVTGVAHPDRIVTNAGARPGDRLILTKPLGTGLMADAYMDDEIAEEDLAAAVASMCRLNDTAAARMVEYGAHACTDITGFGLMGHGREMALASRVCLRFRGSTIPRFELAEVLAETHAPGGLRRNRAMFEPCVRMSSDVPEPLRRVLFDPQTSGGLLIAVAGAESLLSDLRGAGVEAVEVGDVVAEAAGEIEVLP